MNLTSFIQTSNYNYTSFSFIKFDLENRVSFLQFFEEVLHNQLLVLGIDIGTWNTEELENLEIFLFCEYLRIPFIVEATS